MQSLSPPPSHTCSPQTPPTPRPSLYHPLPPPLSLTSPLFLFTFSHSAPHHHHHGRPPTPPASSPPPAPLRGRLQGPTGWGRPTGQQNPSRPLPPPCWRHPPRPRRSHPCGHPRRPGRGRAALPRLQPGPGPSRRRAGPGRGRVHRGWAFGLTGLTSMSWVVKQFRQGGQLDEAKRRMGEVAVQMGQKTKEMGEAIENKAKEAGK
ncbi:hypothetical protein Acr_00g0016560 [Actinidia rufa]|uniref:Uncharacterized protein n=1 Tax=Actinidia rufa TaxID=165716 RepID=A0A7J0DAW8_9ERIC|nr:hypothetical protein Acr_00g0016560 [Actinidia rufa]